MSRKIVRVLGKRGRITIPYEMRVRNKIGYNDILSFEERDKNTIIVRKEKLCGGCTPECFDEENSIPIEDFIDSLNQGYLDNYVMYDCDLRPIADLEKYVLYRFKKEK